MADVPGFDWLKIARDVLAAVDTVTLATAAGDGTTRAVTVGGDLKGRTFEWNSLSTRVHSKQVAENPHVAFNFYDAKTRRAVYGAATLERTESEGGGWLRYYASVSELWVVIDEQIDGKYIEPRRLEPDAL